MSSAKHDEAPITSTDIMLLNHVPNLGLQACDPTRDKHITQQARHLVFSFSTLIALK